MPSLSCPATVLLLVGFGAWLARAQVQVEAPNAIRFPAVRNLTFHYLDTIDVALTTDYALPWLYLWCLDIIGELQEIVYKSPADVKGRSVVRVLLDSNTQYTGNTCWFNLVPEKVDIHSAPIGVNGSRFAYVKEVAYQATFGLTATGDVETTEVLATMTKVPVVPNATPTSSSVVSSMSTATQASSAATSAASSASSGGTPSLASSASSTASVSSASPVSSEQPGLVSTQAAGLSTGAQAGIGIAGVAALSVVATAIWLLFRRRKSRPEVHEIGPSGAPRVELDSSTTYYELPTAGPAELWSPVEKPVQVHTTIEYDKN